ncbi:MAG: SagB family peptide dehydrogenase [Campylobacterota bacterium]|nr:SagB family peptide dehydrogenase [Campylobacterota bacterium]
MPQYHQKTNHSYVSIRKNSFFLDWQTQPKAIKKYPHFYKRFKVSDYSELDNLELINCITYTKEHQNDTYNLRTVPSAGALYPCEIYLQIRGIKSLISGIYHYEPYTKTIALLCECEKDGVEYYFKDKRIQKGITFLISAVYFRSSWKYRDRSIRYIFLDSGHQLGAIYASMCVMGKDSTLKFDFDKLSLNDMLGFREDEVLTTSLFTTTTSSKEAEPLKQKLPYVSGSDYLETNQFIYDSYKDGSNYKDNDTKIPEFFKNISKNELKNAIVQRRSIRAFYQKSISKEKFEFITKRLFNFANHYNIEIYYTLHRVENKTKGLYNGDTLLRQGDFSSRSKYLALEQNLGSQSAVTFYFTSNEEEKYQKVNILSGFIAHIIYLKSQIVDVGCSGIGAYYDEEVKEFLGTKNNILYMLAIGQ